MNDNTMRESMRVHFRSCRLPGIQSFTVEIVMTDDSWYGTIEGDSGSPKPIAGSGTPDLLAIIREQAEEGARRTVLAPQLVDLSTYRARRGGR